MVVYCVTCSNCGVDVLCKHRCSVEMYKLPLHLQPAHGQVATRSSTIVQLYKKSPPTELDLIVLPKSARCLPAPPQYLEISHSMQRDTIIGTGHHASAEPAPANRPRQPRVRAPANQDFLSFMLQSFAHDPARLVRLQKTFQHAGQVDGRVFLRAWSVQTQQVRTLEMFNEKMIIKCALKVLLTWHRCSRRAAIQRIDFEIDSLCLSRGDLNSSGTSSAAGASGGTPLSPRQASTHELRMQSLLAALRQARVAERDAAVRASEQQAVHGELVTALQGELSELKTKSRRTQEKLENATQETKSQNETIGSLCTMYLYKQQEVYASLTPCKSRPDRLRQQAAARPVFRSVLFFLS